MVKVTFYPDGETIDAEKGKTLLEIAKDAKIYIASICGGDGICGRCRVIASGEVDASSTTLLTREDVQKGYVLACQTRVKGDVVVEIPPETRAEEAQILIDEDAQRFRAYSHETPERAFFKHEPLVQKLFLKLPKPTLQDNLSDSERLYREIRRRVDAPIMQTGLKVLRIIPHILRQNNWDVTVTLGKRGGVVEVIQVEGGENTNNYAFAVDVGTSTIVAHLVDLSTSKTIDAEACYNSQRSLGEEVTRRIIYAQREGIEELHSLVIEDINNLIGALISRNNIKLNDCLALICSGNTTMLHFLLGLDPSSIRVSPYIPAVGAPPPIRAAEVGIKINPRGLLYCLPSVGSWVGGDITAGVLATGMYAGDAVCILIDIGTNGEVVLGNKDWMIACSTSAGPAFEGSGVKCGMKASRGAIERVEINQRVHYHTIWGDKPRGICGSGLIDLIAELFRAGLIDRSGTLNPSSPLVREMDGQLEFVIVPESKTSDPIVITQPDIENLLRAKAAIYAGAKILVQSVGLKFSDIDQIYLAGGFGNYLNLKKAQLLGLIPDVPLEKIKFVGNTSIIGAKMALLSEEALKTCYRIAKSITYYDLITYPYYYEEFISAKFIPHTDPKEFPRIARIKGKGKGKGKGD